MEAWPRSECHINRHEPTHVPSTAREQVMRSHRVHMTTGVFNAGSLAVLIEHACRLSLVQLGCSSTCIEGWPHLFATLAAVAGASCMQTCEASRGLGHHPTCKAALELLRGMDDEASACLRSSPKSPRIRQGKLSSFLCRVRPDLVSQCLNGSMSVLQLPWTPTTQA